MSPAEHAILVKRAADAIRARRHQKFMDGERITIDEAAEAAVTALFPRERYFRFDDEAKALVEFKPRSERAA
jgi:hypothetical protein